MIRGHLSFPLWNSFPSNVTRCNVLVSLCLLNCLFFRRVPPPRIVPISCSVFQWLFLSL